MSQYLQVKVPVTDLRRKPVDAEPFVLKDDVQESQLLYNERVIVKEEKDAWYRVEAVEQTKLSGASGWGGYPGWVRKKDVVEANDADLNGVVKAAFTTVRARPSADGAPMFPVSIGTRVRTVAEKKTFLEIALHDGRSGWVPKKDINRGGAQESTGQGRDAARFARLFLGTRYLWGGRSMVLPWTRGPLMGVDCSGLVNLVFRAMGLDLPRDAYDQWVRSDDVHPRDLRAGDLIFVSRQNNPESIYHVMLSLGREQFIEAAETGDAVQARTFAQKFGIALRDLEGEGFRIGGKQLYLRRAHNNENSQ
jgi:cell wall-associated NlpC family hydrolase